ncbi:hypothetical protein Cni_G13476 [Canna indica]|uniref:Uncharacterized protein n=1 Tax=Canna indica TaxID=4628 RepID=A0AAQ3QBJ5_9LILI|nr:hypothetical protein Cni_G13476 [Canna indica]
MPYLSPNPWQLQLLHKGMLLPLRHPQLQMVENLFQEEKMAKTPNIITSSNNSLASSSHVVSEELNADDYCRCSADFIRSDRKSSWSKKLKLIKKLSHSLKLKSSKVYLMSLFNRNRRSDESYKAQIAKEYSKRNVEASKKIQLEQNQIRSYLLDDTRSVNREKLVEEVCHRKSFSGATSWCPAMNSSASLLSSSSFLGTSLDESNQPLLHNVSGCVNLEVECSIEGAIAYCKKSLST